MTVTGLPAAAYGKAIDGRDEYCILWCQHGFTDSAQQALRRLARSYQFLGDSSREADRYPDSFALWRVDVEGSWLAARLRDAGTDSLGRPHTLRIDAVLVDATIAADHRDQLLGFLEAGGWPAGTLESEVGFATMPTAASPIVAEALTSFHPATSTASVLRAGHNQGTNRFDIVLDSEGKRARNCNDVSDDHTRFLDPHAPTAPVPTPISGSGSPMMNTVHGRSVSLVRTLLVLVLAGSTGGGLGYFWKKSESDTAFRKLEASFGEKEVAYKNELAVKERDLKDAREAYESILRQARQLQDAESSFKTLASQYGFTNPFDLEAELKKRGLSPQPGGRGESRQQRLRRLYDSLGAEMFGSPESPLPPGEAP